MNKLKPISTAPKDRDILIAWGGHRCEGFVVGHHRKDYWAERDGSQIEENGYRIFGWTELPELPSKIVVD
jgi:hypothetical protein